MENFNCVVVDIIKITLSIFVSPLFTNIDKSSHSITDPINF